MTFPDIDWDWILNQLAFLSMAGLLAWSFFWIIPKYEQAMYDSAVEGYKAGYVEARPDADSAEVSWHAEWYRDAIHPDSSAYYIEPGTVVYEEPSLNAAKIDTIQCP